MPIFLDTNILIYLLDNKSEHHQWSMKAFLESKATGPVLISDIVYSEFSVVQDSVQHTNLALEELALERLNFTDDALFCAGKAYKEYKKNSEKPKLNVLSDFLIGGQVDAAQGVLITVNPKDFVNYFPNITIQSPD